MSEEPTCFELCHPGIVASLVPQVVVLAMGEHVLPQALQEVFPRRAFEELPIAMGAAITLGMLSFFLQSWGAGEKLWQSVSSVDSKKKSSFPSGGTDA